MNSIPDVWISFVLALIGMILPFVSPIDEEDEEGQVVPMDGMKKEYVLLVEAAPVVIGLFELIMAVAESG